MCSGGREAGVFGAHRDSSRNRVHGGWMRPLAALAALAATLIGTGAASSDEGAVVTVLAGGASTPARSLAERDALGDDELLEVAEEGGCAILLDRSAVIELCGGARVSFERDAGSDTRIVRVDSGELRLLVESAAERERMEIHTPAAIATILGTVVYIAVDPLTGASLFASYQSQVEVRNREGAARETTKIGASEQLTVAPGGTHEVKALSRAQLDALGGCLLDFRDLALRTARTVRESRAVERMLNIDSVIFEGDLEERERDSEDLASEAGIDVTDTEEFRRSFLEDSAAPPLPDCEVRVPPIPGEHCDFDNSL